MNMTTSPSDAQRQIGVEPPCIGACSINPESQICGGCYRHMDEIIFWSRMTEAERERAMENMRQRRQDAENAKNRG